MTSSFFRKGFRTSESRMSNCFPASPALCKYYHIIHYHRVINEGQVNIHRWQPIHSIFCCDNRHIRRKQREVTFWWPSRYETLVLEKNKKCIVIVPEFFGTIRKVVFDLTLSRIFKHLISHWSIFLTRPFSVHELCRNYKFRTFQAIFYRSCIISFSEQDSHRTQINDDFLLVLIDQFYFYTPQRRHRRVECDITLLSEVSLAWWRGIHLSDKFS